MTACASRPKVMVCVSDFMSGMLLITDYLCCKFRTKHQFFALSSELSYIGPIYEECTWCVQVLRSPKEAFAAAMQSWRERCEKCVRLQGDYVEKLLHFQLPVVSSFFK